jgi:opacity protein-like surface antigen
MKKALALAIGLLSLASPARADMFLNAQHAGYAGYAAIGLGYVGSNFGADALYGWTPKRLAGLDVRSVTVKGLWYLFTVGHEADVALRPYLGLGAIYSPDDDLFLQLPEQYPQGYYVPSALRPAFFTGLRLQLNPSFSASLEYALLDSELSFVKNRGGVAYDQVGSVGFALHYNFSAE